MPAARLTAVIDADTTPLTAGLNRAMGSLRSFLTLGALASAARQAIAYGSAINDAATKSGVGVKWLQATAYAAKMAGSSLDELSNALVELRRAQAQALGGSASDASAFSALGISMDALRAASPEALFDQVAAAVKRTNGGLEETNAALQVLGRGGKGLLAGMVGGFSEARQEAERLGLVMEESTIKAMDELGDRLDTLKLGFTALTAEVLKNAMSLNNWVHLAKLALTAKNSMDPVMLSWAYASGGIPAVLRHFVSSGYTMSKIVDSYSAGETSDYSAPAGPPAPPRPPRPAPKEQNQSIELDRLARLGIFVEGGASQGNGLVRIQTQALGQLREMKAYLRRMADRDPTDSIDW